MPKRFAATVAVVLLLVPAVPGSAASTDPLSARQWGPARIKAARAWTVTRGKGAVVAVVDTGVDFGHPDLARNLLDAARGDFVDASDTCPGPPTTDSCSGDGPQDENGHGTHVAGIVAAIAGNGRGIAGVAPRAKILPVRVLDADGGGSVGDVASGIRYAARRGADVINLSLEVEGGLLADLLGGDVEEIHDAVDYAIDEGALVVVAAGNSSTPICNEVSDNPRVICVGAIGPDDRLASFSNSDGGGDHTYVVAPGGDGDSCSGDIWSTMLRSVVPSCDGPRGYDSLAGTSMAAPHVAGVAALLVSQGLSPGAVRRCITQTAEDLGAEGRDATFGFGLVNALRAVRAC